MEQREQVGLKAIRVVVAEGAAVGDVLVQAEGRQRRHQREQQELQRGVIDAPARGGHSCAA